MTTTPEPQPMVLDNVKLTGLPMPADDQLILMIGYSKTMVIVDSVTDLDKVIKVLTAVLESAVTAKLRQAEAEGTTAP